MEFLKRLRGERKEEEPFSEPLSETSRYYRVGPAPGPGELDRIRRLAHMENFGQVSVAIKGMKDSGELSSSYPGGGEATVVEITVVQRRNQEQPEVWLGTGPINQETGSIDTSVNANDRYYPIIP